MSDAENYVNAAIAIMKMAKTESELIELWRGEQANRALLRLTPNEWPGLDLQSAFNASRIKLKQKELT